jgi:hypothetical protein
MLRYQGGAGSTLGKISIPDLMLTTNNISRYGTVYLFLQLVPPFSMFFLLTAAVSSALWAADLEKAHRGQEERVAQSPQYTDDPDASV